MRLVTTLSLFSVCLTCFSSVNASANCQQQEVWLSSGGQFIERWDVHPTEIHPARLANGFELGLQIEPATKDVYRDILNKSQKSEVPELVKISVYDLSDAKPRLLTHTWGGTNSRQAYGPDGGADRVVEVGKPGIELLLLKPNCIKLLELK